MGQFDPKVTASEGSTHQQVHKEMTTNSSVVVPIPPGSTPTNASAQPVKYGELVVLGYNGYLPQGDKGRRRSKFTLHRKEKSSGIKRSKHYVVDTPHSSQAVLDTQIHSISYTLSRNQAVVVEYVPDEETDMFQIGRSSEMPIDFVVMDTVAGDKSGGVDKSMQSTISRFACRILIDRKPPYTARVYAAGFDSSRNIFLGEKASKWEESGMIDGLTTNGVLLLHIKGSFAGGNAKVLPCPWREVSVNGGLYTMRESRSAPQRGKKLENESNILEDGSMIDLCGVTLLWRSAAGLEKSPTRRELDRNLDVLNAARPQCPVGLNTLVVGRKTNSLDREPYVYLKCGHVQGLHEWGQKKGSESKERTCPICMESGPFINLSMSYEASTYCDGGLLTHAFSPCGHMVSEKTARYWSNMPIPHGTKGLQAECPFCATPLEGPTGFVRLIFQDNVD